MPIYEYRCDACGHTLDALQKINDPHLTDCPECDAVALKRLMSAPSFRLKGSGWYETDFKSEKERKRNLADGKEGGARDDKAASDGAGKGESPKSDSSGASASAGDSSAGQSTKGDSGSGASAKPADKTKATKSGSSGRSGTGTEAA